MSAKNLRELFIEELKDVCDAERRLVTAAHAPKLVTAFEGHLKQTEGHLSRVEGILESLGASATRKTCKAMVGLLEEGDELMKEDAPPEIKDIMLIAAAQKVEHYEMATYRTLRTWGQELGEEKLVKLLEINLNEESAADERLSKLALPLVVEANDLEGDEKEMSHMVRPTSGKTR